MEPGGDPVHTGQRLAALRWAEPQGQEEECVCVHVRVCVRAWVRA